MFRHPTVFTDTHLLSTLSVHPPYYHAYSKTSFLERDNDQPSSTSTDDPLVASSSSASCAICPFYARRQYRHGPPVPLYFLSMVHAQALSPSPPTYLPSPGSTLNTIASSVAVEHRIFYGLSAVATIMTFRRIRHTSHAAGSMAFLRPHSRPSGLMLRIKHVLHNDREVIRDCVEVWNIGGGILRGVRARNRRR